MFIEEALRIRELLADLDLREGNTVIDLGSATEEYRCVTQPYIDYYLFRPLRERGVTVVHLDQKKERGVDVVCDITAPESESILQEMPPYDVVICASMLEHAEDRGFLLNRLKRLTKVNGVVILTVPNRFPYHPCPLDTMYRPTNTELEALFAGGGYEVIASEILGCGSQPIPVKESALRHMVINGLNRVLGLFKLECHDKKLWSSKVSIVAVKKL